MRKAITNMGFGRRELLEIQSTIARGLDSGSFIGGYSIDMSAAFDLLWTHVFNSLNFFPNH